MAATSQPSQQLSWSWASSLSHAYRTPCCSLVFREITPGRYQTSEERLEIVTRAVCTIQRYLRGYLGRKRAAYLREKKQASQGGHVQGKVLGFSTCQGQH